MQLRALLLGFLCGLLQSYEVQSISCYICGQSDPPLDEASDCSSQFQYECSTDVLRIPAGTKILCKTTRHKLREDQYSIAKECVSITDHLQAFPSGKTNGCDMDAFGSDGSLAYCVCDNDLCNARPIHEQHRLMQQNATSTVSGSQEGPEAENDGNSAGFPRQPSRRPNPASSGPRQSSPNHVAASAVGNPRTNQRANNATGPQQPRNPFPANGGNNGSFAGGNNNGITSPKFGRNGIPPPNPAESEGGVSLAPLTRRRGQAPPSRDIGPVVIDHQIDSSRSALVAIDSDPPPTFVQQQQPLSRAFALPPGAIPPPQAGNVGAIGGGNQSATSPFEQPQSQPFPGFGNANQSSQNFGAPFASPLPSRARVPPQQGAEFSQFATGQPPFGFTNSADGHNSIPNNQPSQTEIHVPGDNSNQFTAAGLNANPFFSPSQPFGGSSKLPPLAQLRPNAAQPSQRPPVQQQQHHASANSTATSASSRLICQVCGEGDLDEQNPECRETRQMDCSSQYPPGSQLFCLTRDTLLSNGKHAIEKLCLSAQAIREEYGGETVSEGCYSTWEGKIKYCLCANDNCNRPSIGEQLHKNPPYDRDRITTQSSKNNGTVKGAAMCYVCGESDLNEAQDCAQQFEYDCNQQYPANTKVYCLARITHLTTGLYSIEKRCISEAEHQNQYPGTAPVFNSCSQAWNGYVNYCTCSDDLCNKSPLAQLQAKYGVVGNQSESSVVELRTSAQPISGTGSPRTAATRKVAVSLPPVHVAANNITVQNKNTKDPANHAKDEEDSEDSNDEGSEQQEQDEESGSASMATHHGKIVAVAGSTKGPMPSTQRIPQQTAKADPSIAITNDIHEHSASNNTAGGNQKPQQHPKPVLKSSAKSSAHFDLTLIVALQLAAALLTSTTVIANRR